MSSVAKTALINIAVATLVILLLLLCLSKLGFIKCASCLTFLRPDRYRNSYYRAYFQNEASPSQAVASKTASSRVFVFDR